MLVPFVEQMCPVTYLSQQPSRHIITRKYVVLNRFLLVPKGGGRTRLNPPYCLIREEKRLAMAAAFRADLCVGSPNARPDLKLDQEVSELPAENDLQSQFNADGTPEAQAPLNQRGE